MEGETPRRTWLAEERTWLAWWRTGLATSVAAIGVGRIAPELVPGAGWPFGALGVGFALVALAMLVGGFVRHRQATTALEQGQFQPLAPRWVELFTAAGVVLVLATLALVVI
jgi:putative membrane protein